MIMAHYPDSSKILLVILLVSIAQNTYAGYSETLIGIQGKDFVLLASDGSIAGGGAVLTSQRVDKIHIFPNNVAVAGIGDPADVDHVMRKLQAKSRLANIEASFTSPLYDCSTGHCILRPVSKRAIWTVECIAEALRFEVYGRLRSPDPMKETSFLIAGMLPLSTDQTGLSDIVNVKKQIGIASKDFHDSSGGDTTDESVLDGPPSTVQPALFWLDQYGSLQKVAYGAHGHASSLLWSVLDRGWHENMSIDDAKSLLNDCMACLKERFLFNPSEAFIVKCIDQNGCRRLV